MNKSSSARGMAEEQRDTAVRDGKRFRSDLELEELTGIPQKTWQNWRVLGRGPAYRKFGSVVRYDIYAVEAWIEALPTGGAGIPASAIKSA